MPATNSRPRAADVDVLDAQQESAPGRLRPLVADKGGQRVPEMQFAVGAGGEAEDGPVTHPRHASRLPTGLSAIALPRAIAARDLLDDAVVEAGARPRGRAWPSC